MSLKPDESFHPAIFILEELVKDKFIIASPKQKEIHKDFIKELEELLDEIKNPPKIILGGDGSLHYFINEMASPEELEDGTLEVLYLPTGTANDFSKSLRLENPIFKKEFVSDVCQSGFKTKVPIMTWDDRYFINAATMGPPALVTDSGLTPLKEQMGTASYFFNAIGHFFKSEPFKFSLTYKDSESSKESRIENKTSYGCIIAQGQFTGGGVKVIPHHNPLFSDDFHILYQEGESTGDALGALFKVQGQNPTIEAPLHALKVKEVDVEFDKETRIKLDGEEFKSKGGTVCKKGSLNFYLY